MNWLRGLFRLWLVASVLGGGGLMVFWASQKQILVWSIAKENLGLLVMATLVPPALIFLMGHVLAWVQKGFRRRQPGKPADESQLTVPRSKPIWRDIPKNRPMQPAAKSRG